MSRATLKFDEALPIVVARTFALHLKASEAMKALEMLDFPSGNAFLPGALTPF
jgi:hypothetical protein